jgi:hypothetical protein
MPLLHPDGTAARRDKNKRPENSRSNAHRTSITRCRMLGVPSVGTRYFYGFNSTRSKCIGYESASSIESGGLASSYWVLGNALGGGVSFTSRITLQLASPTCRGTSRKRQIIGKLALD